MAIVDVQIACDDPDIPSDIDIGCWVNRALAAADTDLASGTELSVRIVDKDEIRHLNRDFRHKDKVTNVLSFAAGDLPDMPSDVTPTLGDIVICAAVVLDEASAQGKVAAHHWAHLLVHGTLHLLGYDHESDIQADAMEGLEQQILAKYGIDDPYGESR